MSTKSLARKSLILWQVFMFGSLLLSTLFLWLYNLILLLYFTSEEVGQEAVNKALSEQIQMSFYTLYGVISLMLIYYLCSWRSTKINCSSHHGLSNKFYSSKPWFMHVSYHKKHLEDLTYFLVCTSLLWASMLQQEIFPEYIKPEDFKPTFSLGQLVFLSQVHKIVLICAMIVTSFYFSWMFIERIKDPDQVSLQEEIYTLHCFTYY